MCVHMLINAGKDHVTKTWPSHMRKQLPSDHFRREHSRCDHVDNMAKEEQTSSLKLI